MDESLKRLFQSLLVFIHSRWVVIHHSGANNKTDQCRKSNINNLTEFLSCCIMTTVFLFVHFQEGAEYFTTLPAQILSSKCQTYVKDFIINVMHNRNRVTSDAFNFPPEENKENEKEIPPMPPRILFPSAEEDEENLFCNSNSTASVFSSSPLQEFTNAFGPKSAQSPLQHFYRVSHSINMYKLP